jgi:anhydro-N-acetylmuramic acid kinase
VYRVIGMMSGSSLDGLDIAYVHFHENGGTWAYEIIAADCYPYDKEMQERLKDAIHLDAHSYTLLHSEYGHYLGKKVNQFIELNNLHHQVGLISSHGHTTFHEPEKLLTCQLGNGAGIAAETRLPVVSDLRNMDVAFGGQGAPIVPIGEKLLFPGYDYFLNLGGIANISIHNSDSVVAFDICAANRVLNMLAEEKGLSFDENGKLASLGKINEGLLEELNSLEYYSMPYPKSLANSFGTDTVYPIIKSFSITIEDALRTYVEHICIQVKNAANLQLSTVNSQLIITGGGAFNKYLISRLEEILDDKVKIVLPEENVIKYKEALIMGLIGVLRWRQEYNVLASVTGARQNSIGGALWLV